MALTQDQIERMAAVKAQIAAGRTGYLAAMIGANGNAEHRRLAHDADSEIRSLHAEIRRLENELSMAMARMAARKG